MTASLAGLLPPGLLLILAGGVLPLLRGPARTAVLLAAPLAVLVWLWLLPDGSGATVSWFGQDLTPVRVDALSRLFATVFAIMAAAGGLFALRQERTAELAAALVYSGAAIGVTLAGDLITVFVFWEAMAVASTVVIWSAGGERARAAGQRYAAMHLLGGVLLMAGIAGHVHATGSLAFTAIVDDSPARWLILAGFLLNTGAPPFSAWLSDAYPEASWSGTVFLSAFTTKTAVYALIRGFPGEDMLVPIGLFMVFYGIVFAILENDMRRILAYSIVNQVGFMVTAVGIGGEMALNGAAAHAFVHILYKALLLMSAGAVLYRTGKSKCTDLGGLFRTMPVTAACGIVGALAISAFPLTSGFPAKSLISEAAAEGHLTVVWYLLAAASAGVFLHAGIKFPWFVFFQKDSGLRPPDAPPNMLAAMLFLAFACLVLGIFPGLLYGLLPFPADYRPYTASHVVYQLQLLLFSGLAFFLLLNLLKRTRTVTLDVDWLWRVGGQKLARRLGAASGRLSGATRGFGGRAVAPLAGAFARRSGPDGVLERGWPTGVVAFWATALLLAVLLLAYL